MRWQTDVTPNNAMISEHASPLATTGGVDAGGQNIYVACTARHLAAFGCTIDVFARRDRDDLPDVIDWLTCIRVVHVRAGPACFVRKESLLPWMAQFARIVGEFAELGRLARVEPRNPEALARRLAHFFSNPSIPRLLGKRARRRARDHFTWERVSRLLADVYADVAAGARIAADKRARAGAALL